MTTKICTKCKEAKPLDDFYMNYKRNTHVSECKSCKSIRGKKENILRADKCKHKKTAVYKRILNTLKSDDDWQPIPITDAQYIINNKGDILPTHLIQKPVLLKHSIREGYHRVWISKCDKPAQYNVHELVIKAFSDVEPKHKQTVNHIDGNKDNNHISNLEWMSYSDNLKHAYDNDLKGNKRISNDYSSEDIKDIITQLLNGISYSNISNQYGCSLGYLSILRHRNMHKNTWIEVLQDEIYRLNEEINLKK